MQKKNLNVTKLDILDLNENYTTQKPKVIISNDSLYFFSDLEIKAILANVYNLSTEDAIIIINYPVLEAFKGIHDLSVGIKKRKSKRELELLITNSGFEIMRSEFWPFLLSPLIFFVRTIQRVKLKLMKNVKITSDVTLPPHSINKLFYYLSKAEEMIPYKPWGSSLFITAKKKSI